MIKLLSVLMSLVLVVSCKNSEQKTSTEKDNLKLLVSPADSLSAEPYLFTDKNGVVYLSWIEKGKEKSSLKFSRLNNGQWSAPIVIASGDNWFVNWADYPILASDGRDSLIAHILEKSEKSTYTYDVKLIPSFDKGNSWNAPKLLHDDGKKAEHGFVSILPYGENYFISWLDGRNAAMEGESGHHEGHHGSMTVRAAVVNKQGIKSGEWELDNRVCDCCQTSVAITANGPVVVYRDRSEEEIRDISIVRMVNGEWTKPQSIFPDNWKIAGCPVNGPRVDAQGNNLAVAWFSAPDKKGQVNIVFSQDGGANFSTPIRIDEGNGIGRVDVIMLDEKSAMASWMEGSVIKVVRVYNDGKKELSITIASSSESRSSGFPQMTKSGNDVIFAWTDDKQKTIKVASLTL
jgi:hypothetical protein